MRLPIVELFGPSLATVFRKFKPEGFRISREALTKNLRHELTFLLQQIRNTK